MRLYFNGKTNHIYCMLNVARFKLADGTIITVDRDETEWSVDGDNLEMVWRDCYIWDGEKESYLTDEDSTIFSGAELLEVEIEDDSDEDYFVDITDWGV